MKNTRKKTICVQICDVVSKIDKLSKTAKKHRKSLTGDNYYGNKFDELRATLDNLKSELKSKISVADKPELVQAYMLIEPYLQSMLHPTTSRKERGHSKKQLLFLLRSKIDPIMAKSKVLKVSVTDNLIPMDIVKGTRGYIEKIALQANGCYDLGWFDASAVMIRRLIETLIIECFETFKIGNKIKNPDGDYYFLKYLVKACLQENAWTLGRNTKKALPNLKEVGDLSAHSRRYIAKKTDLDKVLKEIRIAVEELVYLSKLKK